MKRKRKKWRKKKKRKKKTEVTVWCIMSARKVIGPMFFKETP